MSILFMHMNSPQVFSVCFCVCVVFFKIFSRFNEEENIDAYSCNFL